MSNNKSGLEELVGLDELVPGDTEAGEQESMATMLSQGKPEEGEEAQAEEEEEEAEEEGEEEEEEGTAEEDEGEEEEEDEEDDDDDEEDDEEDEEDSKAIKALKTQHKREMLTLGASIESLKTCLLYTSPSPRDS